MFIARAHKKRSIFFDFKGVNSRAHGESTEGSRVVEQVLVRYASESYDESIWTRVDRRVACQIASPAMGYKGNGSSEGSFCF